MVSHNWNEFKTSLKSACGAIFSRLKKILKKLVIRKRRGIIITCSWKVLEERRSEKRVVETKKIIVFEIYERHNKIRKFIIKKV